MYRSCPTHGLYQTHRCMPCERDRARRRGTSTSQGYDAAHRKARAAIKLNLPLPCGYCGAEVGEPFVAAHVVDGAPQYGWMAAHASCNERAKRR